MYYVSWCWQGSLGHIFEDETVCCSKSQKCAASVTFKSPFLTNFIHLPKGTEVWLKSTVYGAILPVNICCSLVISQSKPDLSCTLGKTKHGAFLFFILN